MVVISGQTSTSPKKKEKSSETSLFNYQGEKMLMQGPDFNSTILGHYIFYLKYFQLTGLV